MILAISGKRGVGKTLAAKYLETNYKFKRVSFAEKLKEDAAYMWGFTDQDLHGEMKESKFKTYGWTPRHFMIEYGKFMRDFDPDYWVKRVDLSGKRMVLDDLRYPNEARALKEMGAKLIRLERFDHLNIYKVPLDDYSETALDEYKGFDYLVGKHFNETKTGLYKQLDTIMKELL